MTLITNSNKSDKLTDQPTDILQDIEMLRQAMCRLPPLYLILPKRDLTLEQKRFWKNQKNTWMLVGKKIDYQQRKSIGFTNLTDPLDNPEIEPAFKTYLDIVANTLLKKLNIMTAGWDLIQEAALKNKKDFPFVNARKLFAEYCKQQAIKATQHCLSTDIHQGETLGELRGHHKDLKDLYEGNVKGDEETRALSDLLNSNDWFKFSVYAIWRNRRSEEYNDGQLKTAWEEFTKAFKKENTMVCNKNFFKKHGVKLSCLKWNQGRPVHTKSSRPAIFEEH